MAIAAGTREKCSAEMRWQWSVIKSKMHHKS